jgi:hypothetical protein
MKTRHFARKVFGFLFIGSICLALLIACQQIGASGAPGSPLKVAATLSPEPIVGQDVNWHIELSSSQPELPNTNLEITLPESVELVSGELNYVVDIPASGTVPIDLVIRVTQAGEWKISAFASVAFNETSGFGVEKWFHITSSATSAKVIEDVDWVYPTVPLLQIMPTDTPAISLTPTS